MDKYRDSSPRKSKANAGPKNARSPCKFVNSKRGCRMGEQCPYSHEDLAQRKTPSDSKFRKDEIRGRKRRRWSSTKETPTLKTRTTDNVTKAVKSGGDIPGFYFDKDTNKYFKLEPGQRPPAKQAKPANQENERQDGNSQKIYPGNLAYLQACNRRGIQNTRMPILQSIFNAASKRCFEFYREPLYEGDMTHVAVNKNGTAVFSLAQQRRMNRFGVQMVGNRRLDFQSNEKWTYKKKASQCVWNCWEEDICGISFLGEGQVPGSVLLEFAQRDNTKFYLRRGDALCMQWESNCRFGVGSQRALYLFDINRPNTELIHRSQLQSDTLSMGFLKHSPVCLYGSRDGVLRCWDHRDASQNFKVNSNKKNILVSKHASAIDSIRVLGNGFEVVATDMSGSILVWDMRNRCNIRQYLGHKNNHKIFRLSYCEEYGLFCIPGSDGQCRIWHESKVDPIATLNSVDNGKVSIICAEIRSVWGQACSQPQRTLSGSFSLPNHVGVIVGGHIENEYEGTTHHWPTLCFASFHNKKPAF
eukprot:m.82279 g.82279  ORF g.82279 m.82279 type:complete len:529 (-) comp12861_c0_seq6:83-1669(-)